MSEYVTIKTLIIPKAFSKNYNEFLELIETDEEFTEVIRKKKRKDGNMDRRYIKSNKNKMESIKIRFAIAKLLKQLKIKKLSELTSEKNDTTQLNNN